MPKKHHSDPMLPDACMEEREIHNNEMAVIRLRCRKEMGFLFHVFIYLVFDIEDFPLYILLKMILTNSDDIL